MAKIRIPRELPQCSLLECLAGKADKRRDVDFDFFGALNSFRARVAVEVRQINLLFPEYTPHDEQYHLKHLFHVADTVLGGERFENMNSAELLVLALGLYGHDWGMAVSETEKQYILAGVLPDGTTAADLALLRDERGRARAFARDHGQPEDAQGRLDGMPVELWRGYVRETHATRSGCRVRKFFEAVRGDVGEAAARVCEGHWLNFEDLEDYNSYPPNFSVLSEEVNLRALAVYARLVDLLDLAEDRAPYVIWKFVAPRDPGSRMEWEKHRALQPVTCPAYQRGRAILVDGGTDDHEVYAALEDLHERCEGELRGCNDVLARMRDPRHTLDLQHVEWRVRPHGFSPVSIRFEFDRQRMFEILGDEIYQGDPYVFLRELLQNSIDAIRMRRKVLERAGIPPGELGVIRVNVEHGEGGNAKVVWHDDGVGMDEHIVRNYLAVAGRSYYHSSDFERLGIQLDPISRFGVGILSCFMVANRIEIETMREPYVASDATALRVKIPSVERQFRVEVPPREAVPVGTMVTVWVEGSRLPVLEERGAPSPLNVTDYLAAVAGFVEFPIVVLEGDRKSVILHPGQDPEAARRRFGSGFEVHQLDLSYPWSEAILPQDLAAAREVLREVTFDVQADLGLADHEGRLTYLAPRDEAADVDHAGSAEGLVGRLGGEGDNRRDLRWADQWAGRHAAGTGLSRSSQRFATYAVYRDGILLPDAEPPRSWLGSGNTGLPDPLVVVNLPKARAARLDLARTRPVGEEEHWDSAVYRGHLARLCSDSLDRLLALPPSERVYEMGCWVVRHRVRPETLWGFMPRERCPVPVRLTPYALGDEVYHAAQRGWLAGGVAGGPLAAWAGLPCVLGPVRVPFSLPTGVHMALGFWRWAAAGSHAAGAVVFLSPPWEGDPALLQRIMVPCESADVEVTEALLYKAVEAPTSLNAAERAALTAAASRRGSPLPLMVEFPGPFSWAYGYGAAAWNLGHPRVQSLLRVVARFQLARMRRSLRSDSLGRVSDALDGLLRSQHYTPELSWATFAGAAHRLEELARTEGLLEESEHLVPKRDEFVPGTVLDEPPRAGWTSQEMRLGELREVRPFGQPLA
jgi:hypothetical protein